MAKKTGLEILTDLKKQQKSLADKISKIEHKQLLNIGKAAKKHALTEWNDASLDKAFKFLQESGENDFIEKPQPEHVDDNNHEHYQHDNHNHDNSHNEHGY
jgi:hypothetical protein